MAASLGDLPELDQQVLLLLDEGKTEQHIAELLQISIADVLDVTYWLRLMLLLPQETPAQDIVKAAVEKGSFES